MMLLIGLDFKELLLSSYRVLDYSRGICQSFFQNYCSLTSVPERIIRHVNFGIHNMNEAFLKACVGEDLNCHKLYFPFKSGLSSEGQTL
jgi:hypothetical protein